MKTLVLILVALILFPYALNSGIQSIQVVKHVIEELRK